MFEEAVEVAGEVALEAAVCFASGMSPASDDDLVHVVGRAGGRVARVRILALVAVALTCGVPETASGASGAGTRPPTRAERQALTHATDASSYGDKGTLFIRVSVPDSRYAVVGWQRPGDPADWLTTSLYDRSAGSWHLLYWISGKGPRGGWATADGACAVAPGTIVWKLYHYRCRFTRRQLHASPATNTEAHALQAVLSRYFARSSLGPQHLGRACISRVDPTWAAANGTTLVWFRRTQSTWRVAYVEGDPTPKPPHAIVLSLGSCVGYFPSDYY